MKKSIVLRGAFEPLTHTHLQALVAARSIADTVVVFLRPQHADTAPWVAQFLTDAQLADQVYVVGDESGTWSDVKPDSVALLDGTLAMCDQEYCNQFNVQYLDRQKLMSDTAPLASWYTPHLEKVVANLTRPWGDMDLHHEHRNFWIKSIRVSPSQRLSLQSHAFRTEVWIGLSGVVMAEVDGVTQELRPGDMITIPVGARHRLSSETSGSIIEIAVGPDVREDDIVRYEDDYKRI